MSNVPQLRRIWKCRHCGQRSTWREGWNWRLPDAPIETLDSFETFCSPACRKVMEAASETEAV